MRRLEFTSSIQAPLEEVWDFFSSPHNLSKITPPSMNFRILTPVPATMYKGMMIAYKVSPIAGIRMSWLTEITNISEQKYFIDEQRLGPYKIWHHEHHFRQTKSGVEMHDILTYAVPFGILGKLLDWLFIRKKVEGIFTYREKRIRELFFSGD